ncbi:hypothetical protein E1B28_002297 [Marasmius oreades]|uniref:Uncharacterized protein n=1 Tax=Marasmius oreades TaxID=181124 RepID=A0A9P7RMK2_9AGAR|nr:uncharacterized protein E1B28_002297 [Marasmius oreades]KAG7086334.1 hypothetical protein E1B28_002297 [Marasmius oreades]
MPSNELISLEDFCDPVKPSPEQIAFEALLTKLNFNAELKVLGSALTFGQFNTSVAIRYDSRQNASHIGLVRCEKTPVQTSSSPLPKGWAGTDCNWTYSPNGQVPIEVQFLPQDTLELDVMIGACALGFIGGFTNGLVVLVGGSKNPKPWVMTAGHAFHSAPLKDGKFADPHHDEHLVALCHVPFSEECDYCYKSDCDNCPLAKDKVGHVLVDKKTNKIFNFYHPALFANALEHQNDVAVFSLSNAKLTALQVSTCQEVIGDFVCDSDASPQDKEILEHAQSQFAQLSAVGLPIRIDELAALKAADQSKKPLYLFMKGMKTGWVFGYLSRIDIAPGIVFIEPFKGVSKVPVSAKGDSGALWFVLDRSLVARPVAFHSGKSSVTKMHYGITLSRAGHALRTLGGAQFAPPNRFWLDQSSCYTL